MEKTDTEKNYIVEESRNRLAPKLMPMKPMSSDFWLSLSPRQTRK